MFASSQLHSGPESARVQHCTRPTAERRTLLPHGASSRVRCRTQQPSVACSLHSRVGRGALLRLAVPATALVVVASVLSPRAAASQQPRPGEVYQQGGRTYYTVNLGDNLTAIARRFGTTLDILVEANGLQSALIVPGQVLWLPRTYTIQKGDTLYKIARTHGTTLQEILKINNIEDPNVIQAGDIMLLP